MFGRILLFAILASLVCTGTANADEGCDYLQKSSIESGLGYDFIETKNFAEFLAEDNSPRTAMCVSRNNYSVSVGMVDECLDTGNFIHAAFRAAWASCTAEMTREYDKADLLRLMGLDG